MKRIPEEGDLLLIWNNAVPFWLTMEGSGITHKPRNPLSSAVSQDDGSTWIHVRDIEIGVGYDNGYPSVSFVDSEALVTYYSTVKSGDCTATEVNLKVFPITWFYES